MISYTVSFTLYAPEKIPRHAVEDAVTETCREFRVGSSLLLAANFSISLSQQKHVRRIVQKKRIGGKA